MTTHWSKAGQADEQPKETSLVSTKLLAFWKHVLHYGRAKFSKL